MPIKIIRQNITKIQCDAIVNPTNSQRIPDGGTDYEIHLAAGKELMDDCTKGGFIAPGEVQVTKGYALPCRYIIHTVGPLWQGGERNEQEKLENCYKNCLSKALEMGCESIAFPLISSGRFGYPKDRVLKIAVSAISDFLRDNEMAVYIAVYDKTSFEISNKLFADISSYIDKNRRINDCFLSLHPLGNAAPIMASKSMAAKEECTSLDDMLENMDKGFADTLFYYIDKKGYTDVECYKKANVDKKTFSKIKCNNNYRPSKITAVSFAIALRLDIDEAEHLLKTAGMSLSRSNKFDIIIEYFLTTGNYTNIYDVNETLYQFDQMTLGV